jgi:hypothetical protein
MTGCTPNLYIDLHSITILGVIQGILGVIQGTLGVIQGTFGVIQGTCGVIQIMMIGINMLMPVKQNSFTYLRVLLVLTDRGILVQSN